MIGELLLYTLEVLSVLVYFDLWLVLKQKRHFWEQALKLISVGQRKTYQNMYKISLQRDRWFCVSDKVDVMGTTFNTVLMVANLLSLVINLAD